MFANCFFCRSFGGPADGPGILEGLMQAERELQGRLVDASDSSILEELEELKTCEAACASWGHGFFHLCCADV